ncbi:MAG: 16S rRNA processing protein RimM [Draconibacterium sp.]|nr:MAG: 16S rRNA processing protein RimM [Draconibacterium sp.]
METIPKAECVKIGFIRKTHGVHGEVVLEYEPQFEETVVATERFFLEIDGLLVPFFTSADNVRVKASNSAILPLDDVDTEKYARRLVGCMVYLFQTEIIQKEETKVITDYTGYLVFDENKRELGRVIYVDDFSGNIVFTIKQNDNELLAPFNNQFVLKVNHRKKTIQLNLPHGLASL